jgi:glycosyltransferase involved in cell wall biosynthesis
MQQSLRVRLGIVMKEQPIRVVMVGDCAWVAETLVRYAPPYLRYKHLTRTRSVFSKTLGIALRIILSNGDLYHVHYGLQDHLLTRILKRKPTVCHVHGSDLRNTIRSPYGWIVKTNLRTANKVIVAVPDILEIAKSYREDAEYIPNPVNLNLFRPSPIRNQGNGLRVLFASALSFVKGAQDFIEQFAGYQRTNPNSILHIIRYGENQSEILHLLTKERVRFRLHEPVPHDKMPMLYHDSDVVVTDLKLGYLHLTSLEAMACNRPVLQYIDERLYSRVGMPSPPVMKIGEIRELRNSFYKLTDKSAREEICREQLAYVRKYHDPTKISKRIIELYRELIGNERS